MHLTQKLCVVHALLISYHLWFLPKRLHAFHTHTMRTICPTNIISSFLNAKSLCAFENNTMRATYPTDIQITMHSPKKVKCIWLPYYACYML
jgi:hypothetical protein